MDFDFEKFQTPSVNKIYSFDNINYECIGVNVQVTDWTLGDVKIEISFTPIPEQADLTSKTDLVSGTLATTAMGLCECGGEFISEVIDTFPPVYTYRCKRCGRRKENDNNKGGAR